MFIRYKLWSFFDQPLPGEYSCFANKLCSQQLAASRVFSSLSLDLCLDQCNQDPTCHSIQHECGSQCWLLGQGRWTFSFSHFCCTSIALILRVLLTHQMPWMASLCSFISVESHSDDSPVITSWVLRLMNNGATCGTESLSTCGTSIYYKRSYYASTTGVVSPGACFPSTVNTGTYTCVAETWRGKETVKILIIFYTF